MAKKRKVGDLELDVTSFSDIAFLLIIFFILATSLTRPWGRVIEMPAASKPEVEKTDDKTPSVNILVDRIRFAEGEKEDREVSTMELRAILAQYAFALKPEKERMVVVETAEEVTYQRYYEIVTMIAECGGIIAMVQE